MFGGKIEDWYDLVTKIKVTSMLVSDIGDKVCYEPTYSTEKVTNIFRGGNAEKLTFDWVIGLPRYGCEVVVWVGGFKKKYSKFNFGH